MSLTRIGSIGINTGIAFAGVTTIVTLNTANDALSIGATVNVGSGITLGASGDIFATGVCTATSFVGSGANLTGIDTDLVSDTSPQLGGNLDVNTKNIVFGDSGGASDDRLTFGAGTDLSIYHDGSNSYISDQGTGILQVNTNYFQVKNAADDEFIFQASQNGPVTLFYDNSAKLATTSGGIDLPDQLQVDGTVFATGGLKINSDSTKLRLGAGDDLQIYHNGSTNIIDAATSNVISFRYGGSEQFFIGSSEFKGADSKKIKLGTGDDMQLYHDGSHSNIINTTGVLKVRGAAGQSITFRNGDDSANVAVFNVDDATHLYHDSAHKFSTTSGGVKTIGQAEIDGNCFPYSDNNSDLGLAGNRWQDLYLSGNIYLGGTGSANALDDYEEGTWTPTNSIGLTVTNSNPAYYLKIGKMVMIQFDVSFSGASDTSQCGAIQSLPFNAENTTNHFAQSPLPYISTNSGNNKLDTSHLENLLVFIAPGDDKITIYSWSTSSLAARSLLVGRRIRHQMIYKAA